MNIDPQIPLRRTLAAGPGIIVIDVPSPSNEVRRYRGLDILTPDTASTVTVQIIGGANKAAGVFNVVPALPADAFRLVWPLHGVGVVPTKDMIWNGDFLDVPAGNILRVQASNTLSPGTLIVDYMYERITLNRLKWDYGPDVQFDPSTGEVTYRAPSVGRIPLQVPVA